MSKKLTNRLTTVKYLYYSRMWELEYTGELKQALAVLKQSGVQSVISGSTVTRDGYLIAGNSSTTELTVQ